MVSLLIILAIISMSALIYKTYLDIKIKEPDKKETVLSILAFRRYGASTLLPLKRRANSERETKLRRIILQIQAQNHSALRLSTGFESAALIACQLTVSSVIATAATPASPNTHQ